MLTERLVVTNQRRERSKRAATGAGVGLVVFAALLGPRPAAAQSPTFGLGRSPRADELKAIDIEVLPDGRGLPDGSGTAEAGQQIYAARCVTCHGATGKEGPQDVLVGGAGTLSTAK